MRLCMKVHTTVHRIDVLKIVVEILVIFEVCILVSHL
jgi:hypothetical protein